jgi:hypothetical protein
MENGEVEIAYLPIIELMVADFFVKPCFTGRSIQKIQSRSIEFE